MRKWFLHSACCNAPVCDTSVLPMATFARSRPIFSNTYRSFFVVPPFALSSGTALRYASVARHSRVTTKMPSAESREYISRRGRPPLQQWCYSARSYAIKRKKAKLQAVYTLVATKDPALLRTKAQAIANTPSVTESDQDSEQWDVA